MESFDQKNNSNINIKSKFNCLRKKISKSFYEQRSSDSTVFQVSNSVLDEDIDSRNLASEVEEYEKEDDLIKKTSFSNNVVLRIANVQLDLCEQSIYLKQKVNMQIKEWNKKAVTLQSLSLDDCIRTLEDFIKSFEAVMMELKDLQINKETVDLSKPGYQSKKLKEVQILLKKLRALLGYHHDLKERNITLDEFQNQMFIEYKDLSFQKDFEKISKTYNLPLNIESYFTSKMADFSKKTFFIRKLQNVISNCHYVFQHKTHWMRFLSDANLTDIMINNATLIQLYTRLTSWSCNVEEVLSDMVDKIHSEKAVSNEISKIEERWRKKEYIASRLEHEDILLIVNYEEVVEECGNSLNVLNSIRTYTCFTTFLPKITEIEAKVKDIFTLSSDLKVCQQFLIQYRGMFESRRNRVKNLLREGKLFEDFIYSFNGIIQKILKNPRIYLFDQFLPLKNTTRQLLQDISEIQSSVKRHLVSERLQFGRFNFIGDSDLIELIGWVPSTIKQYIGRIFPSIKSFNFRDNGDSFTILSIDTPNEETLNIQEPSSIQKYDEISQVFMTIEKQLQNALLAEIKGNFQYFMEHGVDMLMNLTIPGIQWIEGTFSQCLLVLLQILYTKIVEGAIMFGGLNNALSVYSSIFSNLSQTSIIEVATSATKLKIKMIKYEIFYQRSVLKNLIKHKVTDIDDPVWLQTLRFYYEEEVVVVKIGLLRLRYRYEIYGISNTNYMIRTHLTDQCIQSITEAYREHIGTLLFGPAGTGKTETIKLLAKYIGQFILVYNCGESFTEDSFERILTGAAKTGAWVCFDEFNRLSLQKMNIAISFIESIQWKLRSRSDCAEITFLEPLVQDERHLYEDTLIFLTMNKGYKGRFPLPDKVHNVFRSFSMSEPDLERITKVTMHIEGFCHFEEISTKLLLLFKFCLAQLVSNNRFDFGVRTMVAVLRSAVASLKDFQHKGIAALDIEETCVARAVKMTIKPRLSISNVKIFEQLTDDLFTTTIHPMIGDDDDNNISRSLKGVSLYYREKMYQLQMLLKSNKCVIIHGCSGSGKTFLWRTLLETLNMNSSQHYIWHYLIDPIIQDQGSLFGIFETLTGEWKDGLLPTIFRSFKYQLTTSWNSCGPRPVLWIVFDGPISPNWIESMNSLFDENSSLTLSNGERIKVSSNIKVIIEIDSILIATPSTISRCGIVYLDEVQDIDDTMINMTMQKLPAIIRDQWKDDLPKMKELLETALENILGCLKGFSFLKDILLLSSMLQSHIMKFQRPTSIKTIFKYIEAKVQDIVLNCKGDKDRMKTITERYLIQCFMMSLGSDCDMSDQRLLSLELCRIFPNSLPWQMYDDSKNIFDFTLNKKAEWISLCDLASKKQEDNCASSCETNFRKIIVKTRDTVRVEEYLKYAVELDLPVIFCGPPGSGKSMTIIRYFEQRQSTKLVTYHFNCETTPSDILRLFDLHCNFETIPSPFARLGILSTKMLPKNNKSLQLVFFFDEINLQQLGDSEIQQTSFLLRDLFEHRSFFHKQRRCEVIVPKNVIFVAACNPPDSGGRISLSPRLLSQTLIVFVDHPSDESLEIIYSNVLKNEMKKIGILSTVSYERLASDSVKVFKVISGLPRPYSFYLFTLRDLSRWLFVFLASLRMKSSHSLTDIIKVWTLIGLRVFGDRMISNADRTFVRGAFEGVLKNRGDGMNVITGSEEYILGFAGDSEPFDIFTFEDLKLNILNRFRKNWDSNTILTDQILDQLFRLMACVSNSYGGNGVMLIGQEGSGREYLCELLSAVCGVRIIRIHHHHMLKISLFVEELRKAVRLVIFENKKVIVLLKYNSFTPTDTIEKVSPILSNGCVDNIFDEDERLELNRKAKELKTNMYMMDSDCLSLVLQEKLVFIIIVSSEVLNRKSNIINSEALLNRCHIMWFGKWSSLSFHQVARKCVTDMKEQLLFKKDWESDIITEMLARFNGSLENLLVNCHKFAIDSFTKETYGNITTKIRVTFTDCHFLRFLKMFHKVFMNNLEKIMEKDIKLKLGIEALQETINEMLAPGQSLKEAQEKVEMLERDSVKKLSAINDRKLNAQQTEKQYEDYHKKLVCQENFIFQKRKELDEVIQKHHEELLEAESCIKKLERRQIFEIKTMRHPPESIQMACEAMCDLLNVTTTNWKDVLGVLLKENFVSKIINFSWTNVSEEKIQEMFRKYLENPEFTVRNVSKSSITIGLVVKWTLAQLNYCQSLHKVSTLKEELEKLDKETDSKKASMLTCKLQIERNKKAVINAENEYSLIQRKIDEYRGDIEIIKAKVSKLKGLTSDLQEQCCTWKDARASNIIRIKSLIIQSVTESTLLCYAGHLTYNQKKYASKELHIKSTNPGDIQGQVPNFMKYSCGSFHYYNSLINSFDDNCKLIIDHTDKTSEVLRSILDGREIMETSFCDLNFYTILKTALPSDSVLIVWDADFFDPIISSIIRPSFKNNPEVNIEGERLQISPNLKVILCCDKLKWIVPIELSVNVSVICANDSYVELEQLLEKLLLLKEDPNEILQMTLRSPEEKLYHEEKVNEAEDNFFKFLNNKKATLQNIDETILNLNSLRKILSNDVAGRNEYHKNIERLTKVSSRYILVFETLQSLIDLCDLLRECYQPHSFHASSIKFFLKEFFANSKIILTSNMRLLCSTLLQEFFYYFLNFIRLRDRRRFTVNICYIKRKVVDGDFGHFEEISWNTLYMILENCVGNKGGNDMNINLLDKYLSDIGLEKSILRSEEFQTWINQSDISTLRKHLPTMNTTEERIFIEIISSIFRPQDSESSLNALINSILDIDAARVTQTSSMEYLRKTLLNQSDCIEPVLMYLSKEMSFASVLRSITPKGCRLRVVKVKDLLDGGLVKIGLHSGGSELFWLVIPDVESLHGEKIKEVKDIVTLFKSIYIDNKHFRIIFIANLLGRPSLSLVRICKIVIIEPTDAFKVFLDYNLQNFEGLMCKYQRHINARLVLLHFILQGDSGDGSRLFHNDYNFNDLDFICATNIIKDYPHLIGVDRSSAPRDQLTHQGDCYDNESVGLQDNDISNIKFIIINQIYGGRINNSRDHLTLKRLSAVIFDNGTIKTLENLSLGDNILRILGDRLLSDLYPDFFDWLKIEKTNMSPLILKETNEDNEEMKIMPNFSSQWYLKKNLIKPPQGVSNLLIRIQRKYQHYMQMYQKQISLTQKNYISRFILQEVKFGCDLLDQLLSLHKMRSCDRGLESKSAESNLQDLYLNKFSDFDYFIEDIFSRMLFLESRLDSDIPLPITMNKLFHAQLFIVFTKIEASKRMSIPLDSTNLYFSFQNQSFSFSCVLFQFSVQSKEESAVLKKLTMNLFWENKGVVNNANAQLIKVYQFSDKQDLICTGLCLSEDLQNSKNTLSKDNIYFISDEM